MHAKELTIRTIGFIASLLLTLASFFVIIYPEFLGLKTETALVIILAFALLQAIVQATCFLHVLREKGPRWNQGVLLSTLSIIFIIIAASIWIMHHLHYMMP